MKCWKCGAQQADPPWGKLPFRATCEACNADLHCCRNCVHYKPGLPNDCNVPNTEYIRDRCASNLCEEFKLLGKCPQQSADPNQAAKRLFGETTEPKRSFDDLFN